MGLVYLGIVGRIDEFPRNAFKTEKLFNASRIRGHWSLWLSQEIEQNLKKRYSGTEIVKRMLDNHGIAIRTKNIHRRAKKLEKCQI